MTALTRSVDQLETLHGVLAQVNAAKAVNNGRKYIVSDKNDNLLVADRLHALPFDQITALFQHRVTEVIKTVRSMNVSQKFKAHLALQNFSNELETFVSFIERENIESIFQSLFYSKKPDLYALEMLVEDCRDQLDTFDFEKLNYLRYLTPSKKMSISSLANYYERVLGHMQGLIDIAIAKKDDDGIFELLHALNKMKRYLSTNDSSLLNQIEMCEKQLKRAFVSRLTQESQLKFILNLNEDIRALKDEIKIFVGLSDRFNRLYTLKVSKLFIQIELLACQVDLENNSIKDAFTDSLSLAREAQDLLKSELRGRTLIN